MGQAEEVRELLDGGREAEANALLEEAAAKGDADACFRLADWRFYGLYGPQDFERAYALLGRAAALGHLPAARARAYLTASGIGCAEDFAAAVAMLEEIGPKDGEAARQLAFLPRMLGAGRGAEADRQVLSPEPRIELIKGLLSSAECDYLRQAGGPRLRPAMIVDPATGSGIADPVRRSEVMSILAMEEDLVVRRINLRLAEATGTDVRCGEPLNILRYFPGQEYRLHHDAYPTLSAEQRVATALIYLNRDFTGGETEFPALGIVGRGDVGDVLLFANTLPDGSRDDRTYHAGRPVLSGAKWLATRWIRAAPYVPS